MDLSKYTLEDVILAAIKGELNSNNAYAWMANCVDNAFLKEKLKWLATEEVGHKNFLESLYSKKFPGKEIVLPESSPVPMPEIKKLEGDVKLSEVLESAMEAERAAKDFYFELSKQFANEPEIKRNLEYLASMEWGHYKLLEIERENSLNFESYDEYWPMMHIGA